MGPGAVFQSLGVANTEDGEAAWYRSFFDSLLSGQDVGESLATRRATQGGLLKYVWAIVGSSLLSFDPSNH